MSPDRRPERVLVLAPVGQDAALTVRLLSGASVVSQACATFHDVVAALEEGAGAVLLSEEALDVPGFAAFAQAIHEQPPWSDIAILFFAGSPHREMQHGVLRLPEALGNVTLLERPVPFAAVISTVRAALRSRRRQYEMRDLLLSLRESREDAEAANRLKDEFLATLSHELRTPLNAILGWTMMLRSGHVDPARVPHVLEVIDRNARLQAQLIEDLLDVSRAITGKLRLNVSRIPIAPLIQAALDTVRPAAQGKQLTLTAVLGSPDAELDGDPARLQQVFWNLLTNAVTYTPPGGAITVEQRVLAGEVEVIVRDTGVGISPAFLPHIFERFRQGEVAHRPPQGGLGLGLAIVRHLVELHGGHISARSEGVDKGACFTLRLPAHARPADAPREPGGAQLPVLAGTRVLVALLDSVVRRAAAQVLREAGATVVEADSTEGAIDLVADLPHVLLADLPFAGEDDSWVLQVIRRLPSARGGDVWVVGVTPSDQAGAAAAGDASGFHARLEVPIDPAALVAAVRRGAPAGAR